MSNASPKPGLLGFAALALPLVLLFLSFPSGKPFSVGSGLGFGLFAGGLGALIPFYAMWFGRRGGTAQASVAGMAIAPIVVGIALLTSRGTIMDMLSGIALGWVAVTILIALDFAHGAQEHQIPALAISAGFAVALCASVALGTYRDELTPLLVRGTWASIGLLLGGLIPLLGAFRLRIALPSVVVALPFAVVTSLAARYLGDDSWRVAWVLGGSLLICGLVAGLLRPTASVRQGRTGLALLVLAVGVMAATQFLGGWGASLLALTMFGFLDIFLSKKTESMESGSNPALLLTALFGVALVLFRWNTSRWSDDLRSATLADHYALFSILVGAFLPSLLASVASRRDLIAVCLAALIGISAPCALVILFGAKCALGLSMGLALGVGLLTTPFGEFTRRFAPVASLFALAIALVPLQLTGHLLPLADMPRAERIKTLIWVAAIVGALITAFELTNKFQRDETPALKPSEEAR